MENKPAVITTKAPVGFASGQGLTPTDLEGAFRCANLIAASGLAPAQLSKPEQIVVAAAMGAEIGLSFMQSLQSIAVINGRPTVWGDALLALVENTGELAEMVETVENGVATCKVTRLRKNGTKRSTVETFSMQDAEKAGLAGKVGPWKQYPNRMLKMRARTFALRDLFPDVLKGITSREEAADMPPIDLNEDGGVFTAAPVVEQPSPGMEAVEVMQPVAEEPTPQPQKEERKNGSVKCPPDFDGRKPGKMVPAASCPDMCDKYAECPVFKDGV